MTVRVVGAGVIGLTTAIRLLEDLHDVQVIAVGLPSGTVSSVAGAMCGPVIPGLPTTTWAQQSDLRFRELAEEPGTGVRTVSARLLSSASFGHRIPPWAAGLPGFRACEADELPVGHAGFRADLPCADMPTYLDHLLGRLSALGGELRQDMVTDLTDVSDDVEAVVNCTGLGSARLTGDSTLMPVRGQHVIVDAPHIEDLTFEASLANAWISVLPQPGRVVLGGISRPGDTSLLPDPDSTTEIYERCVAAVPELEGAPITNVEVGLRPGRPTPRLELVRETVPVIHNYGHGSAGVAHSWGCAEQVSTWIKQIQDA